MVSVPSRTTERWVNNKNEWTCKLFQHAHAARRTWNALDSRPTRQKVDGSAVSHRVHYNCIAAFRPKSLIIINEQDLGQNADEYTRWPVCGMMKSFVWLTSLAYLLHCYEKYIDVWDIFTYGWHFRVCLENSPTFHRRRLRVGVPQSRVCY